MTHTTYDVYEVPMYHSGTFAKAANGKIVAFHSDQTGKAYPIKRLEPESFLDLAYLVDHDADFLKHLYAEDMVITHEVSGDVDAEGFCTASWLDGKPSSEYKLTQCFQDAIDDTVQQEAMQASEYA